jgi:hypothetical protein
MTDKEFVLSVYPDASIESNHPRSHKVFSRFIYLPWPSCAAYCEAAAWKKAAIFLRNKMLRVLEQ